MHPGPVSNRAAALHIPPEAHALSGLPASLWDETFPTLADLTAAVNAESCGEWDDDSLDENEIYRSRRIELEEGPKVLVCSCRHVRVEYSSTAAGYTLGQFQSGYTDSRPPSYEHSPSCLYAVSDPCLQQSSQHCSLIPMSLWDEKFLSMNSLLERMDELTGGTWDVTGDDSIHNNVGAGTIECMSCCWEGASVSIGFSRRGTIRLRGFSRKRGLRGDTVTLNSHHPKCPVMMRLHKGIPFPDVSLHRLLVPQVPQPTCTREELLYVLGPGQGLFRISERCSTDATMLCVITMPPTGDRDTRSQRSREYIPLPPGMVLPLGRYVGTAHRVLRVGSEIILSLCPVKHEWGTPWQSYILSLDTHTWRKLPPCPPTPQEPLDGESHARKRERETDWTKQMEPLFVLEDQLHSLGEHREGTAWDGRSVIVHYTLDLATGTWRYVSDSKREAGPFLSSRDVVTHQMCVLKGVFYVFCRNILLATYSIPNGWREHMSFGSGETLTSFTGKYASGAVPVGRMIVRQRRSTAPNPRVEPAVYEAYDTVTGETQVWLGDVILVKRPQLMEGDGVYPLWVSATPAQVFYLDIDRDCG
ncbi:hypothetical protein KIPB_001955 [Kipferlia bialata]|uniref:Uncharacterized protein n=1 Tax=Kipferlia bialata TaxID=797122 RepID=A0A9K3GFK3_9EUKA|nr:hypothetical protein KIPB_001955 [Kipferlia bialata]|eukprot:g1955.t1